MVPVQGIWQQGGDGPRKNAPGDGGTSSSWFSAARMGIPERRVVELVWTVAPDP